MSKKNLQRGLFPNQIVKAVFFLSILIVVIFTAGFYTLKVSKGAVTNATTVTSNPTPSVANANTYTSTNLGISFTYASQNGPDKIGVQEVGNRIYVYSTSHPYYLGQFVEVVNNPKKEDMTHTINDQILSGKNLADCPVTVFTSVGNYPSSYREATINYSSNNIDSNGFLGKDLTKCPSEYTETTGKPYFLEDSNHPGKVLFIYVGQYGIGASDNASDTKLWQDTISFL